VSQYISKPGSVIFHARLIRKQVNAYSYIL